MDFKWLLIFLVSRWIDFLKIYSPKLKLETKRTWGGAELQSKPPGLKTNIWCSLPVLELLSCFCGCGTVTITGTAVLVAVATDLVAVATDLVALNLWCSWPRWCCSWLSCSCGCRTAFAVELFLYCRCGTVTITCTAVLAAIAADLVAVELLL